MYKTFFNAAKRSASTVPTQGSKLKFCPAETLNKIFLYFDPGLTPMAVNEKSLSFLKNEFIINHSAFISLKEKNQLYSEMRKNIEKSTKISNVILEHYPLSSLDKNLRLEISEAYVTSAKMELDMNSFLPLTEEERGADAETIRHIKENLKKALEFSPENVNARSFLGEIEYTFIDLLRHNEPSLLRKK